MPIERPIFSEPVKGDIAVDGFNLTTIIEYNGNEWDRIAVCHSGDGDLAIYRDIKNARKLAAAGKMLSVLKNLRDRISAAAMLLSPFQSDTFQNTIKEIDEAISYSEFADINKNIDT